MEGKIKLFDKKKIKNRDYIKIKTSKSFLKAREDSRDIYGVFNKKFFVHPDTSFNQVHKKASVDLRIKKIKPNKYGIYASPKKHGLPVPHPVMMGRKPKRRF